MLNKIRCNKLENFELNKYKNFSAARNSAPHIFFDLVFSFGVFVPIKDFAFVVCLPSKLFTVVFNRKNRPPNKLRNSSGFSKPQNSKTETFTLDTILRHTQVKLIPSVQKIQ